MSATTAAAPRNRVRGYFDPTADLPAAPADRREFYADCLMAALAVLRDRLRGDDDRAATAAAQTIVAFEQTRMRHSSELAGCDDPPKTFAEIQREIMDAEGPARTPEEEAALAAETAKVAEAVALIAEDEAAQAAAVPPVYAATVEAATAAHAAEMLEVLRWARSNEAAGDGREPDLAQARRTVARLLGRMAADAAAVPLGRFWDTARQACPRQAAHREAN